MYLSLFGFIEKVSMSCTVSKSTVILIDWGFLEWQ